jgi:hypothetical protein
MWSSIPTLPVLSSNTVRATKCVQVDITNFDVEADDPNDNAFATDNNEVAIKIEAPKNGSDNAIQAETVGGDANPETQSRVAHEATDPISSTNNIATNTSGTEDNTDITATQSQSARSVPPHLRSDLHSLTRQASVQSPRVSRGEVLKHVEDLTLCRT